MEIKKPGLITEISVKECHVSFFPTDFPINRRKCNVAW